MRLRALSMRTVGPDVGVLYADRFGAERFCKAKPDSSGLSASLLFQSFGSINPLLLPAPQYGTQQSIPRDRILEDAATQVLAKRKAATVGPRFENPYAAARFGPQFGNRAGSRVLSDTKLDLLSVAFDAVGIVVGAVVVITSPVSLPVIFAGAATVGSVILLMDDGTLLAYDLKDNEAMRTQFDDSTFHHISELTGGVLMAPDLLMGGYHMIAESVEDVTKAIPESVKEVGKLEAEASAAGEKSRVFAHQSKEMRAQNGDDAERNATIRKLELRAKEFDEKQKEFNKKVDEALEKVKDLKRDLATSLKRDGLNYAGEAFSEVMIGKNLHDFYHKTAEKHGTEATEVHAELRHHKAVSSQAKSKAVISSLGKLQGSEGRLARRKTHVVVHSAVTFKLNDLNRRRNG